MSGEGAGLESETTGTGFSGTLGYMPPTAAQMLVSPMMAKPMPSARHTYPKFLRAFSPGVMPHLAAKSQIP